MDHLFAPAVALMNRLSFGRKFALIGVVILAALALILSQLFISLTRDIAMVDRERAGIAALMPAITLTARLQEHRGMSAGAINGNEQLRAGLPAKQQEVEVALAIVAANLPETLRNDPNWLRVNEKWGMLKQDGLDLMGYLNFAEHTDVIAGMLRLINHQADAFGITLDPEISTYYLLNIIVERLPTALEILGQVRGKGTGYLAARQINEKDKAALSALLATLTDTTHAIRASQQKIERSTPEVGQHIRPLIDQFASGVTTLTDSVTSDILFALFTQEPKAFFEQATTVINHGYALAQKDLRDAAEAELTKRRDAAKGALLLNAAVMGGVLILVLYISLGAYFSVIRSVRALESASRQLAAGDLSAQVEVSTRDELSSAQQGFNQMAQEMSGLIRRLQETVGRVRQAAEDISRSAGQMAEASQTQSSSATAMAASVEEMTVGIDHVAHNTDDTLALTRTAGERSRDGARTVAAVVEEINGIHLTVRQTAVAIEALGERSQAISAIVGVIRDIADQTNLLALNAAIEAARAGEAGRGFAVVADEVRKLAERTAKSTREIADMVTAIQSGTDDAVKRMTTGVARVESGVRLAERAGESMQAVDQETQRVITTITDIAGAVREQSSASADLARSVEQIAQAIERNAEIAGKNADTSAALLDLANTLQTEVDHFRT